LICLTEAFLLAAESRTAAGQAELGRVSGIAGHESAEVKEDQLGNHHIVTVWKGN
jgi:hypothetical protein